MKIFFKKSITYELAGTMDDVRKHISSVAKNWGQFSIEWRKHPDALWINPNPLPGCANPGPKFYYPYFHGKFLITSTGISLIGTVSIGGYLFEMLRSLLIGQLLFFSYLTLQAIIDGYFAWALFFSLLGCSIIWIFMQFCVLSASAYEEKSNALADFLNALIHDIQRQMSHDLEKQGGHDFAS
jgi:hypothetical protein